MYGELLNGGNRQPIFWGFMASASAMLLAGIAHAIWGVAAERKSLENIA